MYTNFLIGDSCGDISANNRGLFRVLKLSTLFNSLLVLEAPALAVDGLRHARVGCDEWRMIRGFVCRVIAISNFIGFGGL